MKFFSFTLIVIAVVFSLGCEREDPITPATEDSYESVSMDAFVAEVARNGANSRYKKKTVTLTATVQSTFVPKGGGNAFVFLFTHNKAITFFVNDIHGTNDLAHLSSHTTYNFTLYIEEISESTTDPGIMLILANVFNLPTRADIDVADVTLAAIVTDVALGNKGYIGKTVSFEATVLMDTTLAKGIISLITNNTNVHFFIVEINNPEKLDQYKSTLSYTFTLYIESIDDVENQPGVLSITAGIADD